MSIPAMCSEEADGYIAYVDVQIGQTGMIQQVGRYSTPLHAVPVEGDFIDLDTLTAFVVIERVWEFGDDYMALRLIVEPVEDET